MVFEGGSFKSGIKGVYLEVAVGFAFCPEVIGNIYENPELLKK